MGDLRRPNMLIERFTNFGNTLSSLCIVIELPGGGPPLAAIRRGGKNGGDKRDIRHVTTFGAAKLLSALVATDTRHAADADVDLSPVHTGDWRL